MWNAFHFSAACLAAGYCNRGISQLGDVSTWTLWWIELKLPREVAPADLESAYCRTFLFAAGVQGSAPTHARPDVSRASHRSRDELSECGRGGSQTRTALHPCACDRARVFPQRLGVVVWGSISAGTDSARARACWRRSWTLSGWTARLRSPASTATPSQSASRPRPDLPCNQHFGGR